MYVHEKPFLSSVIDRHLAELNETIAVRTSSADGRASCFYKRRTITIATLNVLYGAGIIIPLVAGTMLEVKEEGGAT